MQKKRLSNVVNIEVSNKKFTVTKNGENFDQA